MKKAVMNIDKENTNRLYTLKVNIDKYSEKKIKTI